MLEKKKFNNIHQQNVGGLVIIGAGLLFIIGNILQTWIPGTLGFAMFLFGSLHQLLSCPWFGLTFIERFVFGTLTLFFLPIFPLAILYFSGLSFSWMLVAIAYAMIAICLILVPTKKLALPKFTKQILLGDTWYVLSIFGSLLLLILFFAARTNDAIISPWNLFNGEIFVLFGFSVLSFLIGTKTSNDDRWLLPGTLLLFSALSVSAIIYQVGFGFDPFLHRAAEAALIQDGIIFPKQLLYSGQYLFVGFLSQLTQIDIKWIDVWLVPAFASLWLPAAIYFGLQKGWKIRKDNAKILWLVAFLIPFQLLTFTVPFTVTFTLFVGSMFLFPIAIQSRKVAAMLFVSCIAAALYHPLLAVPLGIFFFSLFIQQFLWPNRYKWIKAIVSLLIIGASIPVLLIIYQFLNGQGFELPSLISNSDAFFNLWRSPYWDPYPYIPVFLDVIYELRYYLPYAFALIAIILGRKICSEKRNLWFNVYWIGLMITIYATSTLFQFKDIILHEQKEFALRLLHVWFVFTLPFVALLVVWIEKKTDRLKPIVFGLLTLLLVHSWYFSFPQYNLKFPFYSPSVGQEDIETVHWIDTQSQGDPYLVLSNQMTSAAAIQELGFAHYYSLGGEQVLWYAIPTGGQLYENFNVLLEGGFTHQRLNDLAQETGVKEVYVVLPTYYDQTIPNVINGIEELSTQKQTFGLTNIFQLIA